jgi:hypothetical protein
LNARGSASQRGLPLKIRTPHKGKFFLAVIKEAVAPLQALHSSSLYLGNCVEVWLKINSTPALLAQGQDILNLAQLLLPACISRRLLRQGT